MRGGKIGFLGKRRVAAVVALALAVMLVSATALADLKGWQAMKFDNGNFYEGVLVDGKAGGIGRNTYASGVVHIGSWHQNAREDLGEQRGTNGERAVGVWRQSKLNGYSIVLKPSENNVGNKYIGQYKEGMADGLAVALLSSGHIYMGEWKEGKYDGFGVLFDADGAASQVGVFVNGAFVGKPIDQAISGKLTYSDSVYEGEVRNGKKSGYGILTYTNGGVREGYFEDDVLVMGYKRTSEGQRQVGGYVSGSLDGVGAVIFTSGSVYVGDFMKAVREGEGALLWPNSDDAYVGGFKNSELAGTAIYTKQNGLIYIGDFASGKYSGKGFLIEADGVIYEGDFTNGKRNGTGVQRWPNGDMYEGAFTDGAVGGK